MIEVLGEYGRAEPTTPTSSSSSSSLSAAAVGAGNLALPLLHALGSIVSGAEDAAETAPEGVSTAAAGVCVCLCVCVCVCVSE